MRNKFATLLALALLAGCAGNKKEEDLGLDRVELPSREAGVKPPEFALPGVPLRSELEAEDKKEAAVPEAAPQAEPPAAAQPAAAPAGDEKELDFHLGAARRYAAARKYRSAAAEYGAAAKFVAPGDPRAVHLAERQGAMLMKGGNEAKAAELFRAAIAAEQNGTGPDLANAHLGLGYCLEKAGKTAEALASYEKALALSTNRRVKARLAKTIADLKKTP